MLRYLPKILSAKGIREEFIVDVLQVLIVIVSLEKGGNESRLSGLLFKL